MDYLHNQRGSVLVFITLMMVLLMIMVGLGLDTGIMTYTRSTAQGAVDAAALSAVSALPSRSSSEVEARAAALNNQNTYINSQNTKIGASSVSYIHYDFASHTITNYGAPIGTANGVRVALEQANGNAVQTPAFLTPLMNLFGASAPGLSNVSVSAVSVAWSRPSLPIVLWSSMCNGSGTDVKIQLQHPDQKTDGNENACWTTYLDCSSGAPDIKAGFEDAGSCSGTSGSGQIAIGTPICQNKGQVNSVLGTAKDFFAANPNRWWLVPVINGSGNCAAKDPAPIVNWAKIYPKEVVKTGNPKYIKADVVCGTHLINELDNSLCFSNRLVRDVKSGM